ncbi:MFS transporter [Tsukamurella soli]|uniref:MFS transporter n=1 Tax=Tsukamurella soli TaxID=644556 RepID=UPI00361CA21F
MLTTPTGATRSGVRDNVVGLLSLSLATCLAVTTEMLPVGLLPSIGATFGVAPSTTGLLVTAFAGMVAAFSVPLAIATRRLPRKPLILATVSTYVASNVLISVAPTFAMVAVGRAVGGLAHALFFAVAIGYVFRLVEPGQVGRGLAIVAGGSTAGFVLGVPLSTVLGAAVGWRASFLVLAVVLALAIVGITRLLPPWGAGDRASGPRVARVVSISGSWRRRTC